MCVLTLKNTDAVLTVFVTDQCSLCMIPATRSGFSKAFSQAVTCDQDCKQELFTDKFVLRE